MRRKPNAIFIILAILLVVAVATFFLTREKETMNPTPTEAPVVEPTVEPTMEPVATETPVEPTEVPVEPTTKPTETPQETVMPEPTATSTPAPTATSTPEPTATSTPKPTSTPTPIATPTPIVQCTTNGMPDKLVQTFKVSDTTYIYVFEEGSVSIADTKTGFTAQYGKVFKNPEEVDVQTVMSKFKGILEKNNVDVEPQYLPTPTPTPTAFPTPNPSNPKVLASYKGDSNYGDVTVEAWDNGYVYVKGSGEYNTSRINNLSYMASDISNFIRVRNIAGVKTTHIVIEEGIEELNEWPLIANKGNMDIDKYLVYIELPTTLKEVTDTLAVKFDRHPPANDITLVGYKDGQKVTYTYKAGEDFTKVLKEQFGIESD